MFEKNISDFQINKSSDLNRVCNRLIKFLVNEKIMEQPKTGSLACTILTTSQFILFINFDRLVIGLFKSSQSGVEMVKILRDERGS